MPIETGNSTLIYGVSGSYKTTQVGFFARYMYEKYGGITRLLTGDPGGCRPIQPEIDVGIIQPFYMSGIENSFEIMSVLSKGRWPIPDPKKPKQRANPALWPKTDFEKENIVACAIEGMSTWSALILRQLARLGPRLGENPSYEWSDGSEKIHGTNKSYYGTVQRILHSLIIAFSQLPIRVLWTAHEITAEDRHEGEKIIGPKIAGQAATPDVPSWVGECIHMERYIKQTVEVPDAKSSRVKQKIEGTRGYFVTHPDPETGRRHPCKPRLPSSQIEALLEKFPGGYFDCEPKYGQGGLDVFLRAEDELLESESSSLSDWKKEIDAKRGKK